jgi:GNAT superfamily N-acetyltransferase
MIELTRADYLQAVLFFSAYEHMRPAIWTGFEGRQAGRVCADDPVRPRAAAVWSQDCYLGGEPADGPFLWETADLVRQTALRRPYMFVFAADARWLDVMEPLLAPDGVRRIVRTVFRFDADMWKQRHRDWRSRVPEGYAVARLDALLADYPTVHNLWGTVPHFLAHGFGYAVVQGDERVSRAQTVFLGDRRAEIGIDTLPAHRRRGLARLAACACIEHALRQGLTPEWGAYNNPASEGLARDLGFVRQPDWPALFLQGAPRS